MNELHLEISGLKVEQWKESFRTTLSESTPQLTFDLFEIERLGAFSGGRKKQLGLTLSGSDMSINLNTIAVIVCTMITVQMTLPPTNPIPQEDGATHQIEQQVFDRKTVVAKDRFNCHIDGEYGSINVTIDGSPDITRDEIRDCLESAGAGDVGEPTDISLRKK